MHSGKSKTIEDLGLFEELMASDGWDFVGRRLFKMDRATQGREMRKLGAAPDDELGSVAAVTEDGALVVASASGNNIAAYGGGAGKLILVVGSQKIVAILPEAESDLVVKIRYAGEAP
ncbi:MAG TPA: LUD domain-containing protein [Candidatus Limnocylindrales bacterium]|nr:LUD domain-containing protein [Candidatus Limnocylindrales bacterium]